MRLEHDLPRLERSDLHCWLRGLRIGFATRDLEHVFELLVLRFLAHGCDDRGHTAVFQNGRGFIRREDHGAEATQTREENKRPDYRSGEANLSHLHPLLLDCSRRKAPFGSLGHETSQLSP